MPQVAVNALPLFLFRSRAIFSLMIVGQKPRTVDEAEVAGWDGLETDCATCRILSVLPWSVMRRRSGHQKLVDIKERLVCQQCRKRPATVWLTRRVNQGHGSPATERQAL